jgi:hypothetical protein
MIESLRHWLQHRVDQWRTTSTMLRGLPVTLYNTRPDVDTREVLRRLEAALGLIELHTPHYFRHLRRDFSRVLVTRYACRGAFFPGDGTCLVELTFLVNPAFSLPQLAATILHEAMHARLHRLGFPLDRADRARQERFCRRAEIEFGNLVPGGEPVVQRALASLEASDEHVAPDMDPRLAQQRVAEADIEALAVPSWLKRALQRRHAPPSDSEP